LTKTAGGIIASGVLRVQIVNINSRNNEISSISVVFEEWMQRTVVAQLANTQDLVRIRTCPYGKFNEVELTRHVVRIWRRRVVLFFLRFLLIGRRLLQQLWLCSSSSLMLSLSERMEDCGIRTVEHLIISTTTSSLFLHGN